MPTTLTGLLLFVVLLLPGFAYLVGKERVGTERRTSPFRETVSIVAASVTSELLVTVVSWPLWSRVLDVDRLIATPAAYWRERPGLLTAWALGLLVAAVVATYAATLPAVRRPLQWLLGAYPHPSAVSGWWVLFADWPAKMRRKRKGDRKGDDLVIRAACFLDDGSIVEGRVDNFNQLADDTPDRDLILVAPIERRTPTGERQNLDSHAVCVAARNITALAVVYRVPPASELPESLDPPPDVASGT
jgi:hypothetical protein